MKAERDGSLSHGLFRLPAYVSGLKSGKINGKARPEVKKMSPSVIKVLGNNCLAPMVLNKGLPELLQFIEELIEEYSILRGFIFGFIHTLIPLIGFYTGWSINRLLKIISNGAIAGIVGIVLAHIIADFIAALALSLIHI